MGPDWEEAQFFQLFSSPLLLFEKLSFGCIVEFPAG